MGCWHTETHAYSITVTFTVNNRRKKFGYRNYRKKKASRLRLQSFDLLAAGYRIVVTSLESAIILLRIKSNHA